MKSLQAIRLAAGLGAACMTYVLFGGVVSLAGSDPRAAEAQLAKAKAEVKVAATAPAPAAPRKKL